MSTDYTVYCATCKKGRHIGQRFAGAVMITFGWGFGDLPNHLAIGEWMLTHLEHGDGKPLMVVADDHVPDDIVDETFPRAKP